MRKGCAALPDALSNGGSYQKSALWALFYYPTFPSLMSGLSHHRSVGGSLTFITKWSKEFFCLCGCVRLIQDGAALSCNRPGQHSGAQGHIKERLDGGGRHEN